MLGTIDVPTLRLCSELGSCAYAVVFLFLWLNNRSERHLLLWMSGSLLYALTIAAFSLLPPAGVMLASTLLYAALSLSSVLVVSGVLLFEGREPIRPWMAAPVAVAVLMHVGPRLLAAHGWAIDPITIRSFDALGLTGSMAILGLSLIDSGAVRFGSRIQGRRVVGLSMLAYIPGYMVAIAEMRDNGHTGALARIPLILDQVLLAAVNLGLLSMIGERAQRHLREAALRDPLTGTWNRAGLRALERELAVEGTGVIAIDIDHFKRINDHHGHAAGDDVLSALSAEAFRLTDGQEGALVRLGGDEFMAFLPGSGLPGAQCFAERLRAAIGMPQAEGPAWTISLGVTVVAPGEHLLAAAMARADASLYRAKADGRNRMAA